MIGHLINTFEASPDNTVEAFNRIFEESLNYPSTSIVEIGTMLTGGFREVHIDGNIELINLYVSNYTPTAESKRAIFRYTVTKEGFNTVVAYHTKELSSKLGISVEVLRSAIRRNQKCHGYSIEREFYQRGEL